MPISKIIQGVSNDASQRFRMVLDETTYVLELYYQDTSESWFANLRAADNTPISMGRRLSTNVPIFTHLLTGLEGGIAAISLVSPVRELGRFPWGITHNLVYSNP